MSYGVAEGFTDQGELVHDSLLAGEFPRIAQLATITGGVALTRGSVLGRITDTGLFQLSAAAVVDGSQTPLVILAQDIDVTEADQQAVIYLTGEFNELALTFGEGLDVNTAREALRGNSIFLKQNQA